MVARIPNDIFQFSTISALRCGLATSGPQVSQLPGYGSHGIGTFTNMNGEMLYLDGQAWHMTTSKSCSNSDSNSTTPATKSNPTDIKPIVRPASGNLSLPFVQVTTFLPEYRLSANKLNRSTLISTIRSHEEGSGGPNSFMPVLVSGTFKTLKVRIAGPRRDDSDTLKAVCDRAPEWDLSDVKGRMFGYWTPKWAEGVSVTGWHGHFIADAGQAGGSGGDRIGGHVLDFETGDVTVEWGVTGRYHLGMPRGDEWEELDMGS